MHFRVKDGWFYVDLGCVPLGDWISVMKQSVPELAQGGWHWSVRNGGLSIASKDIGHALLLFTSDFVPQVCSCSGCWIDDCNTSAT